MSWQAGAMENKGNMMIKIFRALNAAILKFVMGIKLRSVGATILGGFAGLSLTSTVIPSALEFTGIMDSFSARWGLGGMPVYSVLLWAVSARSARKIGDTKIGAIALGAVGLLSGLVFTGYGIGTDGKTLLVGGGAALLYGAIGGMMITEALRDPVDEKTKTGNHERNKKRS